MGTETKTKLAPPWTEYVAKLTALFVDDPDVDVDYDEEAKAVTVRVKAARKADALAALLPHEVALGNITLAVRVVSANEEENVAETLRVAFGGNPALVSVESYTGPFGAPLVYAAFSRSPVDLPVDNMADPNGNKTMLMETIARDVLGDGVRAFFCTAEPHDD